MPRTTGVAAAATRSLPIRIATSDRYSWMPRASRYLELQGITGTALRATPCAGLALYGRRLWETMSSHWPTADQQPGVTPAEIEFARRWRDMAKVVFSPTTSTV